VTLPEVLTKRVRIPVMAAPLCIVSNLELVLAQCKAGIIGSFPAQNASTTVDLAAWLQTVVRELQVHDARNPKGLSAPFAIGLVVHHSNKRLESEVACVRRFKVPIVLTTIGADREVNDFVHGYGGIVLHAVTNDRYARKAIERGADGLIAVAAGAGGYAGTQSPFALMQEIRMWFKGPVLLAGSIASGQAILAARALGADLAYVGSAFIATNEANASSSYKYFVTHSSSQDVVGTSIFNGVHGNFLRMSIVAAGLNPESTSIDDRVDLSFSSLPELIPSGAQIWGAGQGIGALNDVTHVSHLVARLTSEYYSARDTLFAETTPASAPIERRESPKWPRGQTIVDS